MYIRKNQVPRLLSEVRQSQSSARTYKPAFTVQCHVGCPPVVAASCRTIVHQAIRTAIKVALNAASKLEASQPDAETVRLFRFFFGHFPSRLVLWAGNKSSGTIVAQRFRRVAEELGGGRRIIFRCDATCAATTNARTNAVNAPNQISLCQRFWTAPAVSRPGNSRRVFRAGVILHEMLHLLYNDFFHHPGHPSGDPTRRRDNSHCYEAFSMRLSGFGADPADVSQCRNSPP